MAVFSGKVIKIGIFELKDNQKVGWFADKTHSVVCKVGKDGVNCDHEGWISINSVTKEEDKDITWRSKISEEWHEIWEGAEVEFMYDLDGKYWKKKEKTFIDVVKNGTREPKSYSFHRAKGSGGGDTQQSSGGGGYKPKDMAGLEAGHALNGGFAWCQYSFDISKILEASKNVHEITKTLKEEYKTQNPSFSDYDIGATVGASVLNACRIGGTKEVLLENARKILSDLVPNIVAFVKGENIIPNKQRESQEPPAEDD